MRFFFTAIILAILTFLPFMALANHNESHTIQQLQAQIAELKSVITTLLQALPVAAPESVPVLGGGAAKPSEPPVQAISEIAREIGEIKLERNLARGSRGEDVSRLQEFLSQFSEIYPERIVSGNFGPLTEEAVKRFQEKSGIDVVGVIGPRTRAKINEIGANGCSAITIRPCYDKQVGNKTFVLNPQAGANVFKACMANSSDSQRGEEFEKTPICEEERFQYCFEGQSQVFIRKFEGDCKLSPPLLPPVDEPVQPPLPEPIPPVPPSREEPPPVEPVPQIPPVTQPTPTPITTPSIKVLTPNGGEEIPHGSKYLITWNAVGLKSKLVNINLRNLQTNGELGLQAIIVQNVSLSSETGTFSYEWNVLEYDYDRSYYIQVEDAGPYPKISDTSDASFKLKSTYVINVVNPNGGETWVSGFKAKVQWSAKTVFRQSGQYFLTTINLRKAGNWYRTLVSNSYAQSYDHTLNAFTYDLIVPSDIPQGSDYSVEVIDNGLFAHPQTIDVSDGQFSISSSVLTQPTPPPTTTTIVGPPTVSLKSDLTTVTAGQSFTLTVSGTSDIGLAAVWWYGNNTGVTNATVVFAYPSSPTSSSWFTTSVVNPTKLDRAFGSPLFTKEQAVKSYIFSSKVTIPTAGVYEFGANSRDVLYPVAGEPHQASEGAGLAKIKIIVVEATTPSPPPPTTTTDKSDLTVFDAYSDSGKLSVKIGNIGTVVAPSNTGHLYIWIDDVLKWTYSLSTMSNQSFLLPGGTAVVQPQVLYGDRKIKATIDPQNIIAESNENNNTLEKLVTFPPQPVTPKITVLTPNGGETWYAGSKQTLRWTGGDPTWPIFIQLVTQSPFQVYSTINESTANDYEEGWTIPSTIPAGSYYIYVQGCRGCSSGSAWDYSDTPFKIATVVTTPPPTTTTTTTITTPPPPPPSTTVEKPDLTVFDIYNDNDKLSVKIGNIGTVSAPNNTGHLYIWIDDVLKWTYSLSTLANQTFLSPGGISVVQPQTLSGDHKIKATIDPNNAIAETNETNNTLEKTVAFSVPPPAMLSIPTSIRAGWGITNNNSNRTTIYFYAINFVYPDPLPAAFRVYLKKPGETVFSKAMEFANPPTACEQGLVVNRWSIYRRCSNTAEWKIDSDFLPFSSYPAGVYRFYLAAVDTLGKESISKEFEMNNLESFTISTPTSAQSPVAAKPTFQWSVAGGWPTNIASYHVSVFDYYNFGETKQVLSKWIDIPLPATTATYVYDGPALDPSKTYVVRVFGLYRAPITTLCPYCDYISMDVSTQKFWVSSATTTSSINTANSSGLASVLESILRSLDSVSALLEKMR